MGTMPRCFHSSIRSKANDAKWKKWVRNAAGDWMGNKQLAITWNLKNGYVKGRDGVWRKPNIPEAVSDKCDASNNGNSFTRKPSTARDEKDSLLKPSTRRLAEIQEARELEDHIS